MYDCRRYVRTLRDVMSPFEAEHNLEPADSRRRAVLVQNGAAGGGVSARAVVPAASGEAQVSAERAARHCVVGDVYGYRRWRPNSCAFR